jgi:hypothetical protein
MPANGDINTEFGVYRSLCCGHEIMIREKTKFPDCPNHPNLSTIWKRVDVEVSRMVTIRKKQKSDPAA